MRKALPTDSFFNFFSPPEPPTDEALENGEFEDEELEELEEKLEEDYQIGEDLKEKVRPFSYLTLLPISYIDQGHPPRRRLLHRKGTPIRHVGRG